MNQKKKQKNKQTQRTLVAPSIKGLNGQAIDIGAPIAVVVYPEDVQFEEKEGEEPKVDWDSQDRHQHLFPLIPLSKAYPREEDQPGDQPHSVTNKKKEENGDERRYRGL